MTHTIQTRYIDASGATYEIEVGYGEDAEIPSGASLSVSELTTDAAANYIDDALNTLQVSENALKYAKAFDIAIMADGVEVQPKAPVQVSIQLLDAPEIDEHTDVSVVHFGTEVETVDCNINGESVGFEADGFSVYVVTYTSTVSEQTYDYTFAYDGEARTVSLEGILAGLGVQTDSTITSVTVSDPDSTGITYDDSTASVNIPASSVGSADLELTLEDGKQCQRLQLYGEYRRCYRR